MAYTNGDTVVHPRHGVATVLRTETRGDGEDRTSYLELEFATSLRILVPVDAVTEVGLRELPTKEEAAAILAGLAEDADVPTAWAERSATTSARLRSTELAQAALVVRDLTRHAKRSGKPLSSSETTILRTCLDSVASELALVLGIGEDDARDRILEAVEEGAATR